MNKLYYIIKLAIIGCYLVVLSGCAAMSNLAKEMGLAPVTRSEIKTVGVPDAQWAEQNGLSAKELAVYKDLRDVWLPATLKNESEFKSFSLRTNRVSVSDAAYPSSSSYYIVLPVDAVTNIIARSTPFNDANSLCLLTKDGFYFSEPKKEMEKDNETPIYFVYYTALSDASTGWMVENMEKDFERNFESSSRSMLNPNNRDIPWDVEKIKKVTQAHAVENRIAELQAARETPNFSFADFKELLELIDQQITPDNINSDVAQRFKGVRQTLLGQTLVYLGRLKKVSEFSTQTDYSGDDLMFFLGEMDLYSWQIKGDENAETCLANVALMAAEKGNAEAQYRYGKALRSGTGVERNTEKASEWFAKAAAQGHLKAKSELPSVTDAEAKSLLAKADAIKNTTLTIKGFYLGMPRQDAWALLHYYRGKPENTGLAIEVDSNDRVTKLKFMRTGLDLIFKTQGTPFADLVTKFESAYKIALEPDNEKVSVAGEMVGFQSHWRFVSDQGFKITFYDKTQAFDEDTLKAAGIANPGLITGQETWESMVLEAIQKPSF